MIIMRNGVEIQLTEEEVRAAYESYQHDCLIEDAERMFREWVDDHFDDTDSFERRFGCSADEMCYPEGSNYMLERFVNMFHDKFNTGDSEECIWNSAISEVMSELPRPEGTLATYRVTYKEVVYYHFDVDAHSEEEAREIWSRENTAGNPDYQTNHPDEVAFSNIENVTKKEEEDI